jgi:hypothetical protein
LGLKCDFALKEQSDFSEPLIRINTDVPDVSALNWNETKAWDEFASFYIRLFAKSSRDAD